MKPVIGLIPLMDYDKDSYWMLPEYMKGIEAAGGIPVMLPLTNNTEELRILIDKIDGLLLTGGNDINPLIYHEIPTLSGQRCTERDQMETYLFAKAYEHHIPVLGICRGHQMINVLQGGTLYQDLPEQHPSNIVHRMTKPYNRPWHKVSIEENTPLFDLLQVKEMDVNSRHHQAIKDLGQGLKPMAYSEDGLIEAVYIPNEKFIWGIQWHPEHDFEDNPKDFQIFKAFVNACTKSN